MKIVEDMDETLKEAVKAGNLAKQNYTQQMNLGYEVIFSLWLQKVGFSSYFFFVD